MAGGGFFNRVVQYVANELIVDKLANSPSFQRWAVRTNQALQDFTKKSAEARQQLMEQLKQVSDSAKEEMAKGANSQQRKW